MTDAGITRGGEAHAVAARDAAGWLRLAAAPTFAMMALLTAVSSGGPLDALCTGAHGTALGGMGAMYLLMSAFHLAPWLELASGRQRGPRDASKCA